MQAVWDMRTPPRRRSRHSSRLCWSHEAIRPSRAWSAAAAASQARHADHTGDQGWVFPVDKPLAPEKGDTQALAVNTTDNTAEYQAAFAMIYVEDGSDAMNVNEAQAYASCESCSAVAIAYQVVIVVDTDDTDDNVAVPQNLAGALNYDCVNCMTYALAQQLFITVDEPLTYKQKAQLTELWLEMQRLRGHNRVQQDPPDQVAAQLDKYNARILEILDVEAPDPTTAITQPQTAPAPSGSQPPPPDGTVAVTPPSTESTASTEPNESTSAPTTSTPLYQLSPQATTCRSRQPRTGPPRPIQLRQVVPPPTEPPRTHTPRWIHHGPSPLRRDGYRRDDYRRDD